MQQYEQWYSHHETSHTLLLYLCDICFQLKLYGKAYEYSKKYHNTATDLQSSLMHAKICQQIGKDSEYAEALATAMKQAPPLTTNTRET